MLISMIVFTLLVVICIVLSVRQRIVNRELRMRAWDGSETKSSPLSEALTGLIGTAGGIYITLAMLISFLEINIPNEINILDVGLEPLAAVSFFLAIVQPFTAYIFHLRKKIY